ncbi:barstar family protein [Sphingomonas sp.]|uniref:barstar family protein n=1 Tax=Sphingomonas sp. TaxID=28214 RepID=UPI0035C82A22
MTDCEITLDAAAWRDFRDIYAALLTALGAPEWHGPNLDAMYDALVAGHYRALAVSQPGPGENGAQRRPLRVTVTNAETASAAGRAYLARLVTVFDDARAQYGVEARLLIA